MNAEICYVEDDSVIKKEAGYDFDRLEPAGWKRYYAV